MTKAGRDGSSGVGDREVGSAQVAARRHLMERGARDVPRPPWVPQGMPLDDATLIRYAMWRANSGAGLDVPAAATLFIGTVQGLVMQAMLAGDMGRMRSDAPRVFEIYLRGIRSDAT